MVGVRKSFSRHPRLRRQYSYYRIIKKQRTVYRINNDVRCFDVCGLILVNTVLELNPFYGTGILHRDSVTRRIF